MTTRIQVFSKPRSGAAPIHPIFHRLIRWLGRLGQYSLIFAFVFVFVIPFIWILFWSLKTEAEIGMSPFTPPTSPQWENFLNVWDAGRFSKYLPNTLIYAVSIVLGGSTLSCLAGYALARIRFPGREWIFTFFLIGLMVPFFALMIPLYLLMRDFQWLGTRLALIVPSIGLGLPFGIFLMRSFFKSLPEELADAARIDGCGEFGIFRHIMLPLAWPGLATLAVFQFLGAWNMFVEPLLLVQKDDLRPVGLAIFFFQGRYTTDRGMVATGLLLTILPVLILYILLQRKFIEGITAGATK
jgi:ABC-type glycerol-3-phosphate transport system permease component